MEADDTKYQLLTGDFNAQESNDEFDVFLRDYNIANGLDGEWLDTYIPEDATMKTNAIDNIIASRNIEIQNVEAVDEEEIGSDHKILIADCKLLEEEQVSRQLLDRCRSWKKRCRRHIWQTAAHRKRPMRPLMR